MTTRTLTNTGGPLMLADGTVLANKTIIFTLISPAGFPIAMWDAISTERVTSPVTTDTDTDGIFSVELWCNSRGDRPSLYSCTVPGVPNALTIVGSVDEGAGPLSWIDFMQLGSSGALDPQGVTALGRALDAAGRAEAVLTDPAFVSVVDIELDISAVALIKDDVSEVSRISGAVVAVAGDLAAINAAPALVDEMTVQAGIATDQAAIATDKAAIATAQAGDAAASAGVAAAKALLTAADAVQTAADRAQTALDRVATAADRVATDADLAAVNAAAAIVAGNKAAVDATAIQVANDKATVIDDMATVAADKAVVIDDLAAANALLVQMQTLSNRMFLRGY